MRTRWVIHHTSCSIRKTLWLCELTASVHPKTVLLSCPQLKEQYEKVLEDVSGYTPRYMEEMESIFEQSQEEERKRISFLKQAFLSIHRHLDVTNNERWPPFGRCSFSVLRALLLMAVIVWSVWKLCTMSSTKRWCPSMSKRISNGGRTIAAQACLLTGQRLRCVSHIFCTKKVQYPEQIMLPMTSPGPLMCLFHVDMSGLGPTCKEAK